MQLSPRRKCTDVWKACGKPYAGSPRGGARIVRVGDSGVVLANLMQLKSSLLLRRPNSVRNVRTTAHPVSGSRQETAMTIGLPVGRKPVVLLVDDCREQRELYEF